MFGPHVHRANKAARRNIVERIEEERARARAEGFDARGFQIFVAGPRSQTLTLRDAEVGQLRGLVDADPGLRVIAHGTYLDYPWYGKPFPAKFIRRELDLCARAGIAGLVIHLGKPDVSEVVKYLPNLLAGHPAAGHPRPLLYLETPHVKPENSLYETPEKLGKLFRAIREKEDPRLCRLGLCVDTAHLWSCGVDLQSYEAADAWLTRLAGEADAIPFDRLMFHLNDSHDECGSGLDHHAALLEGKIWKDYAGAPQDSGLAAFVDFVERHDLVAILERNGQPEELRADLNADYGVLRRLAFYSALPVKDTE